LENPGERYSVRLIQEVLEAGPSAVDLTIDLSPHVRRAEGEFSIAFQRDDYYGKRVSVLTVDGELHRSMVEGLEAKLQALAGSTGPICDRRKATGSPPPGWLSSSSPGVSWRSFSFIWPRPRARRPRHPTFADRLSRSS
jgi:hypothetical protein